MNKIHVISPASKGSRRPGRVIDQAIWDDEFLGRAEEKDATGFPTKGSFGISFAVTEDLSKFPKETRMQQVISSIQSRGRQRGIIKTLKQVTADAKQLISAYEGIKKGDRVAFKKGTKVIAIVEITSDYTFCGEQAWGWHSWSYRTLKKVTDAEQPSNYKGLLKTFMPNYLTVPDDLFSKTTTSKTYPMPNGAWAWA